MNGKLKIKWGMCFRKSCEMKGERKYTDTVSSLEKGSAHKAGHEKSKIV